jgi:sulfatase modifying factor 1
MNAAHKRMVISVALLASALTASDCGRSALLPDLLDYGAGAGAIDAASGDASTADGAHDGGSSGASSSSGSSSGPGASSSGSSSSSGGSSSGSSGVTEPPSCAPGGDGLTNCGAMKEDCCASLDVEAGTFYRTYMNAGNGPTAEGDPATVSTVLLDKYPTTVGRFRQFVKAWNGGEGFVPIAGSGKHAELNDGRGLSNSASPGTYEPGWVTSDDGNVAPSDANLTTCGGYSTWTALAGARENLPINCVNWYEAYAFCIWDGGFLPSEAEWEYAAAGGVQQLEYPWGSTAPGSSDQYAIYGCLYPDGTSVCTGVANIAPVGTAVLGAGLWGQLDLVGNVGPWILDAYAAYVDPCVDCAYLASSVSRVCRGGDFSDPSNLSPWVRGNHPASDRMNYQGFRCARAP